MNGMNAIGGANGATGPNAADASGFDNVFEQGLINTSAVLMQFIGSDILETVMKDETSVD